MPGYYLIPAMKRSIRGKTLTPIREDYTDKQINKLLLEVIGKPGVSAGKAQKAMEQSMTASSGTSAYTAAQADIPQVSSDSGSFGSGLGGIIGAIFSTLLGAAHADYAAKKAYERQNEYTDNYLTASAQVKQYEDAGLNPMGLAGGGAGVTSAPSVQAAETPSMDGITSLLSGLLSYKAQMARVDVDRERVLAQKEDIASRIEYRAEQKLYQQKINEWFDTNQIVSMDKSIAETQLALERVNSEQMKQKLDEAGISEKQANAALSFQLALQKEFENSPEFRSNTLALQRARASEANANAAQTYEGIKNLAAQRDEISSRIALNYANTDIGKQQLINLGLNAEQIEFAIKHQKGDLIFNRINQITTSLKDIGIATGGLAAGATSLLKAAAL